MDLRTVLLVDDEQQILDTYRIILSGDQDDEQLDELAALVGLIEEDSEEQTPPVERETFRLIEANQGEEALEKQREAISAGHAPAVALVDMRMPPGINGLETAIRLRQQDSSIYIIIITAYSDIESETMQLALQHDFIFLKKPVVPDELYQIVHNAAKAYQTSTRSSIRKEMESPSYREHLKQQQVLLVDDEPMMLKLAEAMLSQYLQVNVLTAGNGEEALRLANEMMPDLILLDVKMSPMNGYEVCAALKASESTKEIPVIFLTAQSSDDQVVEGFKAGAVDYIAKPFSKPILVARVSTHLNLYRQSRRLKMLSNTDSLTQLPNRAAFQNYLDMRLRDAEEAREESGGVIPRQNYFAVLFIDLDKFKPVNDEMGHEVGDQLLQAVAGRLRKNVREGDLVSRIGGDEFVMMMGGNITAEHVALVADNLVNLLCQPFHIDGNYVQIGASVGSARYPDDAEDGETLLRNADMAMYEAKAKGRNCHVSFSNEFEIHQAERDQLASELRIAVEEQQLELYFQPRVTLENREIVGLDGVLRWEHPTRGTLEADRFMALLMEGRLGELAERQILKMACQQLLRCQQACDEVVPVSLTLSAERFKQNNLDRYILDVAAESGLPKSLLPMIELDHWCPNV